MSLEKSCIQNYLPSYIILLILTVKITAGSLRAVEEKLVNKEVRFFAFGLAISTAKCYSTEISDLLSDCEQLTKSVLAGPQGQSIKTS